MLFRSKVKTAFLFFLFAFLYFPVSTQEFGKNIYKEVTVNGEKVFRWVRLDLIGKHDSKGNLIHYKSSDGYESWSGYGSKDGIIYKYRYKTI